MVKPDFAKQYIETGTVRLVWNDFPFLGDESFLAAQGSRCAARQSRFWEYHDYLLNHQTRANTGQFSPQNLKQFAATLKLDSQAFDTCLDRAEDMPDIRQSVERGKAKGVSSTPTFFIGDQKLTGVQPVEAFGPAIQAELRRLGR